MPNRNHKIEEYKKYVRNRLESLTPLFQKIAAGDFSVKIELSEKEDEFTPLVAAISIVLDDLRSFGEENKQKTKSLEEKAKELRGKIKELEIFQKLAVGRELKMIEIKKENENLKKELAAGKGQK